MMIFKTSKKTLSIQDNNAIPTELEFLARRGKAGAAAHQADLRMQMGWLLLSSRRMTQSKHQARNATR